MIILLSPDQSYGTRLKKGPIKFSRAYVLVLALASFFNLNFEKTSDIRKMKPFFVRSLSHFEAIFHYKTRQMLDLYR